MRLNKAVRKAVASLMNPYGRDWVGRVLQELYDKAYNAGQVNSGLQGEITPYKLNKASIIRK